MTQTTTMLDTFPGELTTHKPLLARCIEECFQCAQTCTACADACLSEPNVAELRTCIRLNLDCADICETTGRMLSRHTGEDLHAVSAMLRACATACQVCGEECTRHANHEHCRVCADACQRCQQACQELVAAFG